MKTREQIFNWLMQWKETVYAGSGVSAEEALNVILDDITPRTVEVKEACPVCGCTDWVTTSLYGTECVHCLHRKGMPVEQVNIEAIAEKYTPEILGLMLMPSKEEYHKVRAILIRAAEEARSSHERQTGFLG
jgi:hypothetical protein